MKNFVTFFTLAVSVSISAQNGNTYSGKWRNNSSDELTLPESEYIVSKKGKISYYLSNDDKNIYLDMKIPETLEQIRILQKGLTLWVNVDDKSHKGMGIRFPMGTMSSRGRGDNSNTPINQPASLSQANTIELIGFKDGGLKRFPAENPDNIRGKLRYDNDGNLIYNLIIPMEKLSFKENPAGKGKMPFTFGIEYGTVSASGGNSDTSNEIPIRPATGNSGGRSGGGRGGRSGGSSSGSADISGGIQGGSRVNNLPTQSDNPVLFWIKHIHLAEKN
jgi:hypothetical protein